MNGSFELLVLIGSVLIVVSIFASKVSSRLGLPALLLFLLVVLANAESLVALRGVIEVSVA